MTTFPKIRQYLGNSCISNIMEVLSKIVFSVSVLQHYEKSVITFCSSMDVLDNRPIFDIALMTCQSNTCTYCIDIVASNLSTVNLPKIEDEF